MRKRLDSLLVEKGLAETRSRAAALIMAGQVLVKGAPVTKAGTAVDEEAEIRVKEGPRHVSRAGGKLEAALDAFGVDLKGMVVVDIGASTGGFVDEMLQRGAARVYAVDVGHGQLHWKLRNDPRVVNLEGVNARTLDPALIPEPCDLATFDVSFISLKLVIPPVLTVLKPAAQLVALVKPQFEAGREHVKKGGLMKDLQIAQDILHDMEEFLMAWGCGVSGSMPSPVKGAKGNQEYLVHAVRKGEE